MTYDEIIAFHGHSCPGLAMGYRMAAAGLQALKALRSEDEEIVAIVENDACGVDALQCLTGCTFGKGNLIFRDYGKQAFTFYSRQSAQGVRVLLKEGAAPPDTRQDREAFTQWLLDAPEEALVSITPVIIDEPKMAQSRISIACAACDERVMETRLREIDGKPVCIPCAARAEAEAG